MELREIATGLRFPEGPVALPDGSALVVEIAVALIVLAIGAIVARYVADSVVSPVNSIAGFIERIEALRIANLDLWPRDNARSKSCERFGCRAFRVSWSNQNRSTR